MQRAFDSKTGIHIACSSLELNSEGPSSSPPSKNDSEPVRALFLADTHLLGFVYHFPMSRDSDKTCDEPDEAPEHLKRMKFRERWECLSREATEKIFDKLDPRAVFSGHTHRGCHVVHGASQDIHEYIVTFSWRNKDNPTFLLGMMTPNNYSISKCHMPRESTIIFLYIASLVGFVLWLVRCMYLFSSFRHHSVCV
ncbi:metallophosphoesterase 1-like [Thrips palmi]|uniref:Metallophosphoesterase 1-like n=1 Tax=Thrips palmi TaxID=161013 RepID=A0A6P8ZZR1_THRPL|nr:metallophosphoesterase 1-like [Thrips palmi]